MKTTHQWLVAALSTLAMAAVPSFAAEKDPTLRVALRDAPQESIGSHPPEFGGKKKAVRIVVEDGRTGANPALIGDGTDGKDRPFDIAAEGEVLAFVKEILRRNVEEWGFPVDESSKTVLLARLTRFWVAERNQAVGSMYDADVRWSWTLTHESGESRSGTASGGTKRYGRARSIDNCNEVLSDALKEANAAVLEHEGAQAASDAASAAPAPAAGLTPAAMLAEIQKLKQAGTGDDLMLEWIAGQTLRHPFTTEDVVAWKTAGIGEAVIKAAMARPVAAKP